MDAIKIYKYSLFLPLIVPMLFSPALLFLRSMTESQGLILLTIVYSGLVGGIPYLILIAIVFRWMRGKNEQQIRETLKLSPPFMIGIFVVGFALLNLVNLAFNKEPMKEVFTQFVVGTVFSSICILIFGYTYVLLVFGLVRLLRKQNPMS